jgi:hypothetical protein
MYTTEKTTTYVDGNPCPGLRLASKIRWSYTG